MTKTRHDKKLLTYPKLGEEKAFRTAAPYWTTEEQHSMGKVKNDLELMVNWKSYDAKATMFWISLCGTPKEAREYEYTIKIVSSADRKAGRTKFLLTGTGECLSCEVSHEDVKRKPTKVMLFSQDILKKAAEGNGKKRLEWRLVIKKM